MGSYTQVCNRRKEPHQSKMSRVCMLGLILLSLGNIAVQSLTTRVKYQADVDGKTFQCNFTLKHSATEVKVKRSKLACSPKTPTIKSAKVELTSDGGYKFTGKINFNPARIVSMEVNLRSRVQSSMENLRSSKTKHICGTDMAERTKTGKHRSFTNMKADQFWKGGVIPWAYVSTANNIYINDAVHVDDNVGLDKNDVETIKKAMETIEDKTCIKFKLVKPVLGQDWLFIYREANASYPHACQIAYAKANLVGKDIKGLGDIYGGFDGLNDTDCFPGAFAGYGSAGPQILGISKTSLFNIFEGDVGLIIHELLHVIGIGHTQKRQDASANIKINWGNIAGDDGKEQYEPCIVAKDSRCSQYNTYGTEYDCMSIMHYRDTSAITDAAWAAGNKTMVATYGGCDLSSPNNHLRPADTLIINRMYCQKKCVATGAWAGNTGVDLWCHTNCNHEPVWCPSFICAC